MKRKICVLSMIIALMFTGCNQNTEEVTDAGKDLVQQEVMSGESKAPVAEVESTYEDNIYVKVGDYSKMYVLGKEISMPCTVNELIAQGFVVDESSAEDFANVLKTGYFVGISLDAGEVGDLYAVVKNETGVDSLPGDMLISDLTISLHSGITDYRVVDNDNIIDLGRDYSDLYEIFGITSEEQEDYSTIVLGDKDSSTKMELGGWLGGSDKVQEITWTYNDEGSSYDSFYHKCINYYDMLGDWHKQEPVEFYLDTLTIDSNWDEYFMLDGKQIHYGSTMYSVPFYKDSSWEYNTLRVETQTTMSESASKALGALNSFMDSTNNELSGNEVIEGIADQGETGLCDLDLAIDYSPQEKIEGVDYIGDGLINNVSVVAMLAAETVKSGNGVTTIGIGNTLGEAKVVFGSDYTEIENLYGEVYECIWVSGEHKIYLTVSEDRTGKGLGEETDTNLDNYRIGRITIY